MSDLQLYDERYAIKPNGFINTGANCYLNSILQCLLSCTSIYKTLLHIKDTAAVKRNEMAQLLINLYIASTEGRDVSGLNINIWRQIIAHSSKRRSIVHMGTGQEDAHEGLCMLLESLENIHEIRRLFQHRYRTQIYCDACAKYTVNKSETSLTFQIQSSLKTEQLPQFKDRDQYYNSTMTLNDFIRVQNGYIDDSFKCPECNRTGAKFLRTVLTMAPEILPIVLKKYTEKTQTDFPHKLMIPASDNKSLIYRLVAQCEHSGSMQGGHYWAVALRKTSELKYYMLNDSSVSEGIAGPTLNTYIAFYHIESVV